MARVFAGGRTLMAAVAKSGASKTEASSVRTTPAILRPLPVSPAMRKFLGVPEISRSGAVKKVWDHIKANNLQVSPPPFFRSFCCYCCC